MPLEGILFDVDHNEIWPAEWGPKPTIKDERARIVREIVQDAPRLIPIYGHRYIPDEPSEAGNPVFSVHQTDIVHYGNNLLNYFQREFRVPLPDFAAEKPRPIRFWDHALKWRD